MDERKRIAKWIVLAPLAVVGIVLFTALGGWIVQQLWNWLLPALFGWPLVTFWQALGLLVLCRILFGGFGGHRGSRSRSHSGWGLAERWHRMTPEERERFRQAIRERHGSDPTASEAKGQ